VREGHWDQWFDENHAKGWTVGYSIVGPLLTQVLAKFRHITDRPVQIAIIGDSTTAFPTQWLERWFDEDGNRPFKTYVDYELPEPGSTWWPSRRKTPVPTTGAADRRAGLRAFLEGTEYRDRQIDLQYYSVSGSWLNDWSGGFLQQLACALQDRKYDAVLVVGGWNNEEISGSHLEIFASMLKGDAEGQALIAEWADAERRQRMVEYQFPPGTAYPIAG
jgi:hypothetical protein